MDVKLYCTSISTQLILSGFFWGTRTKTHFKKVEFRPISQFGQKNESGKCEICFEADKVLRSFNTKAKDFLSSQLGFTVSLHQHFYCLFWRISGKKKIPKNMNLNISYGLPQILKIFKFLFGNGAFFYLFLFLN